jgi:hypothetical protein
MIDLVVSCKRSIIILGQCTELDPLFHSFQSDHYSDETHLYPHTVNIYHFKGNIIFNCRIKY